MKNLLALILSISFHLVALYLLLNIELKVEKEEVEKFEIKIVKKEESRRATKGDTFLEPVENIRDRSILNPNKSEFIESYIDNSLPVITTDSSFASLISTRDIEDNFLDSLESLISKPQIEVSEEDKSSKMTINWAGENRKDRGSNYIDFSVFPKESFTGVNISVEFSVSTRGEVYNSVIIPPGSGSVEFDILVLEYINGFTFEPGDSVSTGVINIIYE